MQSNTVREVFAHEPRPGEARNLAHAINAEFLDGQIDGTEVVELREAATHCPICLEVVEPNWRSRLHHRHVGLALPEDIIPEEGDDFRRRLDEANLEIDGDEIILHACTREFIRRKQDIGCIGIIAIGKGLYDAIFPKECVFALMQAGL